VIYTEWSSNVNWRVIHRHVTAGESLAEEQPWLCLKTRPDEDVLNPRQLGVIVAVTPPKNKYPRVFASESMSCLCPWKCSESLIRLSFFQGSRLFLSESVHPSLPQIIVSLLLQHATVSRKSPGKCIRTRASSTPNPPAEVAQLRNATNTCVAGLFPPRNCTSHDCTLSHCNVFE
jgi:hypothetical protein